MSSFTLSLRDRLYRLDRLSLWGRLVKRARLPVNLLCGLDKKKMKGTETLSQGVETWVLLFHLLALQPKLNWTADPPEGAVPGFDLTLYKKQRH